MSLYMQLLPDRNEKGASGCGKVKGQEANPTRIKCSAGILGITGSSRSPLGKRQKRGRMVCYKCFNSL